MVNYKDLGLVNTREMFARAIKGGYPLDVLRIFLFMFIFTVELFRETGAALFFYCTLSVRGNTV